MEENKLKLKKTKLNHRDEEFKLLHDCLYDSMRLPMELLWIITGYMGGLGMLDIKWIRTATFYNKEILQLKWHGNRWYMLWLDGETCENEFIAMNIDFEICMEGIDRIVTLRPNFFAIVPEIIPCLESITGFAEYVFIDRNNNSIVEYYEYKDLFGFAGDRLALHSEISAQPDRGEWYDYTNVGELQYGNGFLLVANHYMHSVYALDPMRSYSPVYSFDDGGFPRHIMTLGADLFIDQNNHFAVYDLNTGERKVNTLVDKQSNPLRVNKTPLSVIETAMNTQFLCKTANLKLFVMENNNQRTRLLPIEMPSIVLHADFTVFEHGFVFICHKDDKGIWNIEVFM
jgi:nuclear transport factor 2 (NTF2) superfamily protein